MRHWRLWTDAPLMIRYAIQSLKHQLLWRVLRRRTILAVAPEFGVRLRVAAADAVGRRIYKRGSLDAERTRHLLHHVPWADGDVILDIGAHIGWYSLCLDRNVAAAVRILAFEPNAENRALLQSNVQLNGASRVTVVDRAVSDRAGTQRLYLYAKKNQGRHSLLPIHDGEIEEVKSVALDEYLPSVGVDPERVAFMKLDIEGGELQALRGAGTLVGVVPRLLLEFSPGLMRRAGQEPRELLDMLFGAGYTAWDVDGTAPVQASRSDLESAQDQRDHLWCLAGAWQAERR